MRDFMKAAAITAAMLASAAIAQPAQAQAAAPTSAPIPAIAEGTMLQVNAVGRTTRTPDLAIVSAGVVTQAPTAAQALAQNGERMTRVLAALRRAGIKPADLQTSNIGLSPQYKYQNGQTPMLTGYQASDTVSVRFRDIGGAGSILDTLVAQGANQIEGPTLTLDNPDAALDEARADAVRRARARAELYARAAGLTVQRIVSISENGENAGPTPRPMFRVAAAQAPVTTQIAAGETDVTATVSVRFLLR